MSTKTWRRGERPYVFRSTVRCVLTAAMDKMGYALVRGLTLGRGLRPAPSVVENPKNILAIRLDHLGDVLFTRPSLVALKTHFPLARLTVLTSKAGRELLSQDRCIDEFITWEAPWFARAEVPAGQPTFLQLAWQLQKKQFDLSLDFRGDLRHHLLMLLAGVKARYGYGITGGGFLLHGTRPLAVGVHEVERNLQLAELVHVTPVVERYVPIPLTTEEVRFGQGVWQTGNRRVVLHPAAGDPAKRWPTNRLIELCDGLSRLGCEVVMVGAPNERFQAEALANACMRAPVVLAGKTDLRKLLAVIASAHLMVGSDSGPAHMAVTQGVPTIMLWSQTNEPEEWGPWGRGCLSAVVRDPEREYAVSDVLAAAKYLFQSGGHRQDGKGDRP